MASKVTGFIGLGIMGQGMAKRLVGAGNKVVVWSRNMEKVKAFAEETKCDVAASAKAVVEAADVTYSMLSTPEVANKVFFDDEGILAGVSAGKAIVDCATLRAEDMQRFNSSVTAKGGRFLEAPVSGTKGPAANGTLIFLTAGDKALFEELKDSDLAAMGKASFFFGDVGQGTRMKLIVNCTMGSMMVAFAEGLTSAEKAGLDPAELIEVLDLGAMSNPMFRIKGPNMLGKKFAPNFPLKHAQKDMRQALEMADEVGQPMPVAAAANASFIAARADHADDDFCAVIEGIRSKAAAGGGGGGGSAE